MNEGKMVIRYIPLAEPKYRWRVQWKSTVGMGLTRADALRDWKRAIGEKADKKSWGVETVVDG